MLDDRIHRTHRVYWTSQGTDPVRKHPVFGKKGGELADSNFKYLDERVAKFAEQGLINPGNLQGSVMDLMSKISRLEDGHEDQLVEIARNTVMELYNIKPEKLNVTKEELFQFSIGPTDEEIVPARMWENKSRTGVLCEEQEDDHTNRSVNKIMMSQGAAMQGYLQVWDMESVRNGIMRLQPNNPRKGEKLLQLYKAFSYASLYGHFVLDFTRGSDRPLGGSTRSKYKEQNDETSGDFWDFLSEHRYLSKEFLLKEQEDKPKRRGIGGFIIKASGMNLAILIQEGIKGTIEALLASRKASAEGKAPLIQKMTHEIPYFHVGPELWRRLLKHRPKDAKGAILPTGSVVMLISEMEDSEQKGLFSALAYMPEEVPKLMVKKMVQLDWVYPEDWGFSYEDLGLPNPEADKPEFEFNEEPDEDEDLY